MLRIYICPECYNFRMVSRKTDANCFHCGATLVKCDLDYSTFMNMSEAERITFKNNYSNSFNIHNMTSEQEPNT